MAVVKPFQAILPAKEYAADIAALPYDVYNREEARKAVSDNPLSFLAIDRAETTLDEAVDIYDSSVYERARELFLERLQTGYFVKDDRPCFYLYRLTMADRSQTGVVGLCSVEEYLNGTIKKHESTRTDKEEDRVRHIEALNAQTGPIFMAYKQDRTLKKLISEATECPPFIDFTSGDGVTHQAWRVTDENIIAAIEEAFCRHKSIYIADGHHRCAAAARVAVKRLADNPELSKEEPSRYIMSVLFSEEELLIMDYNRVVDSLGGMTKEAFLEALSKVFIVTLLGRKARKPVYKGQITMYLDGEWYLLECSDSCFTGDPVADLDVSILQKYVLEPLLQIKDPRRDKHIDFVGGIRGLEALEQKVRKGRGVAFAMYPTDIKELFAVADKGLLMPPKSTWFEPKLRSGLFLHSLQNR